MIHFANNFRSHVAWRATCILRVVRLHLSRYAKVSYSYISFFIENKIFGFEIAMDYLARVQVLQADYYARYEEAGLVLAEDAMVS